MPSTGKPTPFCGLNQWQGPDKPARMDFNQDNEKTDAALSSLSAQLSKKANLSYVDEQFEQIDKTMAEKANSIAIISSGSIRQVLDYPSGSYIVTAAVTDMQINNVWWICSVESKPGGYCRIDATVLENPSISCRTTYANGKWNAWTPIATAAPPQMFSLLLEAGIEHRFACYYFMQQDKTVTVHVSFKPTIAIPNNSLVATVPPGYRSKETITTKATIWGQADGSLTLLTDGKIMITTPSGVAITAGVHCFGTFPLYIATH